MSKSELDLLLLREAIESAIFVLDTVVRTESASYIKTRLLVDWPKDKHVRRGR
jgi:hypothetical protein